MAAVLISKYEEGGKTYRLIRLTKGQYVITDNSARAVRLPIGALRALGAAMAVEASAAGFLD